MNTENAAEVGGVTAQFFGTGSTGNEAANRSRGLGGMSNTRNFFRTDIPNDIYNTGDGGLTLASGPNSILFGLGSPAGLAESRYNVARLNRARSSVSLSTDTNGTRRASLDHNQPLVRDRLGLRLDLLDSDRRFPLRPAYERDRRIFANVGFAPVSRLRLDVYAELMDRQASRPVYVLPRDNLSIWVNPAIGNRTPYNQPDASPTAIGQTLTTANPTSYLFSWTSGQDAPPTYTYGARVAQPGVYTYRYTPAVRPVGDFLINGIRAESALLVVETADNAFVKLGPGLNGFARRTGDLIFVENFRGGSNFCSGLSGLIHCLVNDFRRCASVPSLSGFFYKLFSFSRSDTALVHCRIQFLLG